MVVDFKASFFPFHENQTMFLQIPVDLPHGPFKEERKQLLNHHPPRYTPCRLAQLLLCLNQKKQYLKRFFLN